MTGKDLLKVQDVQLGISSFLVNFLVSTSVVLSKRVKQADRTHQVAISV